MMLLDKSQRHAVRVLKENNGGAVLHKAGEGKTRIGLQWLQTLTTKIKGVFKPRFLCVCRRINFDDWRDEARKLGLDWTVVDYETDLGVSKKTKLYLLSHGMIKLLGERDIQFDAVIFDEGWLYKNPQTEHCKIANKISQNLPAAILSGSVMTAKNLEDIFGLMKAINRHHVLAPTLTEFRTRFMFKYKIMLRTGREIEIWEANRIALDRVTKLISPFTSIYFPRGRVQPKETTINIPPSPLQKELFDSLRKECFACLKGSEVEIKYAPTLAIKCQQISDGYLKFDNHARRVHSEKLVRTLALIIKLTSEGHRVVVWCAFRRSVTIILQQLQKLRIRAYELVGSKRFNSDGWKQDGQVAVATADSGSSFNLFGQVQYAIYYSMSAKWLSLQQSRARTARKNSRHSICYYYYMETDGSMDAHVRALASSSGRKEQELFRRLKLWATNVEEANQKHPTFSH